MTLVAFRRQSIINSRMIESTPKVDAAFEQLIAAFDAEIAELRKVGGEVFHNVGAPWNAQSLLLLARAKASLKEEVALLHEKWRSGIRIERPEPSSIRVEKIGHSGPGLLRNIKGLSDRQFAKKLGVKLPKVREWLEAGTMRGFRRASGGWKIPMADVRAFLRDHRDLV